jgi:hypothetical protein
MSAGHLSVWRRTFILFVISGLARSALSSGTVTNCTQTDLQKALNGGGTVLFACNGTITLTNTLTISADTALDGSSNTVIISGGNGVRLFQVASNANFQLKGLTLADGRVIGTNGLDGHPATPGQDVSGAAILNLGGNLVLNGCTFTNHYLQGGSGGSDLSGGNGARGGNAIGAAICSLGGELNLTNCLIVDNAAVGGNAGSYSGLVGSQPGDGGRAYGGALYCESVGAGLEQLTFTSNSVSGGAPGGAGSTPVDFGKGGDAAAGALYASNSVIFLEKSVLAQNSARGGAPLRTRTQIILPT